MLQYLDVLDIGKIGYVKSVFALNIGKNYVKNKLQMKQIQLKLSEVMNVNIAQVF